MVSGATSAGGIQIRVQAADFDAAAEGARLVAGRHDVGGVVSFIGYCRDEGGTLAALELEHYPGMAEEELAQIAAEAAARWPLLGGVVIHRFGRIAPGEQIVMVACAAAHRRAAFEAADFLMDFLKTRAPFWKKVHRRDGIPQGWVEARAVDAGDAERW
jgi:molybdopterin synthase catalytic subunit